MKRAKYISIAVILSAVALSFCNSGFPGLSNNEEDKDKVIMGMVYQVLSSSHFEPREVDDEFSGRAFEAFIDNLNIGKRILTTGDIKELEAYRHKVDDQIKAGDMTFFEKAYALYQDRLDETEQYYAEILGEPFDFELEEELETDPDKLEIAAGSDELRDRWRAYLKYRVLNRLHDRVRTQEDALKNDSTEVEEKSLDELETEAREKEREMHDDWFNNLRDMERMDWMGVYVNSITGLYDPHTEYFPPDQQEDFEISMSGQLEGIGAQLSVKGEYVTVEKIVSGSASWRQGELEVGDKILKVAQEEEEPVDVVGMSLRKVVKLIRGKKGTVVCLTVQKVDGSRKEICIERDLVEIESTFARSAVVGENDEKVGYIRLPKFYVDFLDDENHNCAEDVKAEIKKLKKEGINGIVLDLRNNGGGSLQAVVDIAGLFIDDGPVVQVKTPNRSPRILRDTDTEVHYDGPLIVLVNHYSASASEIFAAAIQDYERGIIMGSRYTFGKGTVQNVLNMDDAVGSRYRDLKPLGALKLTVQKYYRINGGTPQLKGVEPDVVIPDSYNYIELGEREQENALPYDEIAPAKYEIWPEGEEMYSSAVERSNERIASSEKFQLIDEYAQRLKERREDTRIPLQYSVFVEQQKKEQKESERFKGRNKLDEPMNITFLANQREEMASEDTLRVRDYEKWHKSLSRDLYISEAVKTIGDIQ